MHYKPLILAILLGVSSVLLSPVRVFAVTQPLTPAEQAKSYQAENDVIYYSDEQCSASSSSGTSSGDSGSVGTPDGSTTAGLTAEQAAFVDKYHDIAVKLSIEYGIPWEAVLAQGILESGAGSSDFARNRNNFFGINAVDDNPGQATTFATPEEGFKGYYDFIADNRRYREQGVFNGSNVTNPYDYIKTIKAAGYATDPKYVDKNSVFIKAIEARSKEKGWKNSADLAKENPQMLENASANGKGDGGSAAAPTSDTNTTNGNTADSCAKSSSTASNGDLVGTANEMGSWGEQFQSCYIMGGGHGSLEDLQRRIDNHFSPKQENGVDCSGFVRAVIYKSTGKDPGAFSTDSACADASKFEHIPRADARPGDISIDCANHMEMITAIDDATGRFTTVGSHSDGCGPGKGPSPGTHQGTESFVLRYKG